MAETIKSIYEGFPRGNPGGESAQPPARMFQKEQKVLNSPSLRFSDDNKEGKIFLGLVGASIEIDPKKPRLKDGRTNRYAVGGTKIGCGDDRHIITVAGSRAGKSRAVLVPNLITYPGSMLVIDPKGELAKITAQRRKEMGQDVYVLDPFEAGGDTVRPFAAQFNPLKFLQGSSNLLADAGMIADALVVPAPGTNDPHWDESARNFIEGIVLHVATYPDYGPKRDLVEVYHQLERAMVLSKVEEDKVIGTYALEVEMKKNLTEEGAVTNAARDFYERSDRERDSVLSSARRHLHFLGYPKIQKTLRGSSFDLLDLKRKRMTIYLSLPAMRMGSCSRWLRLFCNLTLAGLEMEKIKPEYPVLMCLDEFAVLGTMKQIEDAAGQIAGLGCKLWVVLQDLGQLKALYKDRWETFMGNAGILQFFGNSELTTLEWIARRLGTTAVINQSQGDVPLASAIADGRSGKSWAAGTADLMTAAEIADFFGRDDKQLRQLIIRPTVPPIVLHRAFYDKHSFFQGKYAVEDEAAGQ